MARTNSLSLESMGVDLPYNMQAEQSVLGAAMLLFKADFIVTDLSPTMLMFGGISAAFFAAMCGLIAVKAGILISRLFSVVKRRCDTLRGW